MIDQIYLKIWEQALPYYQKGRSWDVPHIEWMMEKADEIADIEHADKKLLLPIVILHDVGYSQVNHTNLNIKDRGPKIEHMKEGAKIAEAILTKVDCDEKMKNKIIHYISVHDNWVLDDDSPFQECKEMAIFNDLDFLHTLSNYNSFVTIGKTMEKTPREAYEWWLRDEKLERRPFCCATTKTMFQQYINERRKDIESQK